MQPNEKIDFTKGNCLDCYYFNGPDESCFKHQCGLPHEVIVVGCVDFQDWPENYIVSFNKKP